MIRFRSPGLTPFLAAAWGRGFSVAVFPCLAFLLWSPPGKNVRSVESEEEVTKVAPAKEEEEGKDEEMAEKA